MNIEELKSKWGGTLPQVGDWATNPQIKNQAQMAEVDLYHARLFYDLASPIPLTREVFSKIEEVETSPYRCLQGQLFLTYELDIRILGYECFVFGFDHQARDHPQKKIKYLHQLQQLCRFFHEGKELTYEP